MSHQRKSSNSGFKSRFSLLSLLPARHPPLVISHPAPAIPTHHVHRAQPVLHSSDRVESSYGLTDDPFDYRVKKDRKGRRDAFNPTSPDSPARPKHRPPPLDLTRTRAAFPTVKGVSLVRDDPDPASPTPYPSSQAKARTGDPLPKRNESLPVVRGPTDLKKTASKAGRMFKTSEKPKGDLSKPVRPRQLAHDSYDFVTLEPEHRYPSWKGGKVDIRPGEHIPPDLVQLNRDQRGGRTKSSLREQPDGSKKDHGSLASPEPEQYDSVLHNVLLTPTYLAPSTASKSTTDLMGGKEKGQRQTLLGRASQWGKDVLSAVPAVGGSLAQYGGRSARGNRERDEQELSEVKPSHSRRLEEDKATPRTKRERAISSASSLSTPSPAIRGVAGTPYRRSPAWSSMRESEEAVGFDRERKGEKESTGGGGVGGKRPLVGFNVSWQAGDGKRSVSVSEAWRQKKEKEQAIKRKRLMWRVSIYPSIICFRISIVRLTSPVRLGFSLHHPCRRSHRCCCLAVDRKTGRRARRVLPNRRPVECFVRRAIKHHPDSSSAYRQRRAAEPQDVHRAVLPGVVQPDRIPLFGMCASALLDRQRLSDSTGGGQLDQRRCCPAILCAHGRLPWRARFARRGLGGEWWRLRMERHQLRRSRKGHSAVSRPTLVERRSAD